MQLHGFSQKLEGRTALAPASPSPYSMLGEYLAFENQPGTPILTQHVPEPTTFILALAALAGFLAWRRR